MRLVDVMIVGAGRSGTSALLQYLGHHPGLRAQRTPEMTWFNDPDGDETDLAAVASRYWDANGPGEGLLRLGKAAGLMYDPVAVDRLARTSPGVTAVVILREPARRIYSSYNYARMLALEPIDSFEEAVWADPARLEGKPATRGMAYLDWSMYAKYVEGLFDRLGRDSVSVLFFEDFADGPRASVTPLLDGLGLDAAVLPAESERANPGGRARSEGAAKIWAQARSTKGLKRLLPQRARGAVRAGYRRLNQAPGGGGATVASAAEQRLRAHFAEPNDRLAALLGRDLPASWSRSAD